MGDADGLECGKGDALSRERFLHLVRRGDAAFECDGQDDGYGEDAVDEGREDDGVALPGAT